MQVDESFLNLDGFQSHPEIIPPDRLDNMIANHLEPSKEKILVHSGVICWTQEGGLKGGVKQNGMSRWMFFTVLEMSHSIF